MRRIRIALVACATVLAGVVISQMVSVESAPQPDNGSGSAWQAAAPVVPEPPSHPPSPSAAKAGAYDVPLPPTTNSAPRATPPAPRPVAKARVAPTQIASVAPDLDSLSDAKPVIREVGTGRIISPQPGPAVAASPASASAPAETASAEPPKGPVIVVPHERPKEDNLGVRWMKAVGHAVGIGGPPSPETQAFK
jgi:hypothetical protein